jgi:Sulfotransferase domain
MDVKGSILDLAFRFKRLLLGPQRVRRARLYGVGMGKSGTHSICGMFSKNVRAGHEVQAPQLLDNIFARHHGRISEQEMTAWILARDRKLALEVDSAALNFWILDILLREFPDARFVLSIRDCYSWLNSSVNQWLRFPDTRPRWLEYQKFRFGDPAFTRAPGEHVLEEKGFQPLSGYLSYWTMHNGAVLAKVPAERLFVVRTDQIKQRALEISDFAGLPRRSVRLRRTHEFRNPSKQDIIHRIDRDYLEKKVEQYCRPLMTRFFPEIKSLDDATL